MSDAAQLTLLGHWNVQALKQWVAKKLVGTGKV